MKVKRYLVQGQPRMFGSYQIYDRVEKIVIDYDYDIEYLRRKCKQLNKQHKESLKFNKKFLGFLK